MRSRHAVVPLAASVVLLAAPAGAQATGYSNEGVDGHEAAIVSSLHRANQGQLQMARLAQANAGSDAVKRFAAQLASDHASAEQQVQDYAQRRDIDLTLARAEVMTKEQLELERRARTVGSATGEWAWSWEHAAEVTDEAQPELARLRGLTGAELDREYVRAVAAEQQRLVDRLGEARAQTSDAELAGLVDGLLPTYQQHLAAAQQLQSRVSKAD